MPFVKVKVSTSLYVSNGLALIYLSAILSEINLIAVNPTCTHQGCSIDWKAKQGKFVCPCHGAKFAPDGKAQEGPAKKPLKTYQAKIEGGSILVKAT